MPAPIDTVANDWELAFLGGVAFAVGGGAGMYFAVFRSATAGALEPFYFTTAGVGAGGNGSGFDISQRNGPVYTRVRMVTPFNIRMLHLSAGFLASASVGYANVNFGWSTLNAGRNGVTYFDMSGTGWSAGSGLGALAFAGTWYSHALNNNSANPLTAMSASFRQSVEELLGSWERGIRGIYTPPGF